MTGMEIEAVVQRENDLIVLYLKITNRTPGPITKFLVKIDSNPYQLESGNNMQIGIGEMAPGQTQVGKSLLQTTGQKSGEAPECPFFLKVALMVSIDVFVFKVPCSFTVLLKKATPMSVTAFNEYLQRPNQVKGGDKYQTELGVAGVSLIFLAKILDERKICSQQHKFRVFTVE
jgi:hypothetical protein